MHKDIRILFQIDDRRYEAVGFLGKDERSVSGDEMVSRTADKNNSIIGEEDAMFINEHRHLLPTNLNKYHLVTNQRKSDSQRSVNIFCCHDGSWRKFWSHLDCGWFAHELVVRRLNKLVIKTREELITEMRKWLAELPNPDEPFVGVGDGLYSPRQMLKEVEAGTEFGEQLLASFVKLLSGQSGIVYSVD